MGGSDSSTSQLVQAMAGFALDAADDSDNVFVGDGTSQQTFLTIPQHAFVWDVWYSQGADQEIGQAEARRPRGGVIPEWAMEPRPCGTKARPTVVARDRRAQ
jgi:hypothetical protein